VELCAHFGRARTTVAKRTKNERVAFLNNLKRSVGAQRRDMRNDLAGTRRVWAGKSSEQQSVGTEVKRAGAIGLKTCRAGAGSASGRRVTQRHGLRIEGLGWGKSEIK
jgi:hypothetical protein